MGLKGAMVLEEIDWNEEVFAGGRSIGSGELRTRIFFDLLLIIFTKTAARQRDALVTLSTKSARNNLQLTPSR